MRTVSSSLVAALVLALAAVRWRSPPAAAARPPQENPNTDAAATQPTYSGPAAGDGRRAGVPHQSLGQHQRQQPLRRLPRAPASSRRCSRAGRHQSRLRGRQCARRSRRILPARAWWPRSAGGHNCWLARPRPARTCMTTWISNWAGACGSGGGTQIQLVAPPVKDVGSSRSFPDDSALFGSHHLARSCVAPAQIASRCHSLDRRPLRSRRSSPATNVDEAYAAAHTKINLDDNSRGLDDAKSRLVVRLRDEFHNCWTGNCATDAAAMYDADPGVRRRHRPSRRSIRT